MKKITVENCGKCPFRKPMFGNMIKKTSRKYFGENCEKMPDNELTGVPEEGFPDFCPLPEDHEAELLAALKALYRYADRIIPPTQGHDDCNEYTAIKQAEAAIRLAEKG